MNWTELKKKIYYQDGSLRDIYLLNTTIEDWKNFIDFVRENCKTEWFNEQSGANGSLPKTEIVIEQWSKSLIPPVKIFISNIQINAHFFSEDIIELDIDPKEFNSMEDHKTFVSYLVKLSFVMSKQIIVTPENLQDFVLIKVDGDYISYENI